ncbi:MAG: response regulator [Planctomycetota bacterium]|jgi:CheY-like chemotaxis protein
MNALVVEREWDVRESLKKKLERRGFEVFTAETAEEALNLCVVMDVDLVLTSSLLPEMSGLELIERINQGRKDLKPESIILLDKNESPVDAILKKHGFLGFLTKPVLEENLGQCIDQSSISTEAGT